MKWLAFVLLVLNLVVWLLPGVDPGVSLRPDSQGMLPRVVSLKGDDGSTGRAPSMVCIRLGWFDTESEAAQAGDELGTSYQVEAREVELEPLNWVLIPPQPEQDALEQFRSLSAQGVESYVVASGEYRNAISLGLFESREAAEAVFEEKKRENLNVVLANFPRNRIRYALVFDVEPGQESVLVQAVEKEFGKKFEMFERDPCKGVATSEKTP